MDAPDYGAIGQPLVLSALQHHGVRGMHWGVRKGRPTAPASPPSEDHIQAETHKAKIKTSGVKALSNQDLEQLNRRLQLEKSNRELSRKPPNAFDKTHNHVKKALSVLDTVNKVDTAVTGVTSKAIQRAVRHHTR